MIADRPATARVRSVVATLAFALASAIGLAAPAAALAADVAPTGHGIVTMTRGMAVFGRAEAALLEAVKGGDGATIDRLLGEFFEQRGESEPGTPLPREEWLAQAKAEAAASRGMQQMAVHDHGDLAVVSYLWLRDGGRGNAFVVDVWKRKSGDDYQLVTRYLGRLPVAAKKARVTPAVDPKK